MSSAHCAPSLKKVSVDRDLGDVGPTDYIFSNLPFRA